MSAPAGLPAIFANTPVEIVSSRLIAESHYPRTAMHPPPTYPSRSSGSCCFFTSHLLCFTPSGICGSKRIVGA